MNKSLSELLSIKSSNVNILKFICALLVIIGHAGSITGDETAFPTEFGGYVCGPGGFAVSVFFFFSGLYVTKSLARTSNLKSYIVKRAERIFPQLIVVVFLSAFVLREPVYKYHRSCKGACESPHYRAQRDKTDHP
ncbi:MAG: acyltransferase family protein [Ruminococcus sp.]|nr:acyltransferase family protein [Ruminococcus sp.]